MNCDEIYGSKLYLYSDLWMKIILNYTCKDDKVSNFLYIFLDRRSWSLNPCDPTVITLSYTFRVFENVSEITLRTTRNIIEVFKRENTFEIVEIVSNGISTINCIRSKVFARTIYISKSIYCGNYCGQCALCSHFTLE